MADKKSSKGNAAHKARIERRKEKIQKRTSGQYIDVRQKSTKTPNGCRA